MKNTENMESLNKAFNLAVDDMILNLAMMKLPEYEKNPKKLSYTTNILRMKEELANMVIAIQGNEQVDIFDESVMGFNALDILHSIEQLHTGNPEYDRKIKNIWIKIFQRHNEMLALVNNEIKSCLIADKSNHRLRFNINAYLRIMGYIKTHTKYLDSIPNHAICASVGENDYKGSPKMKQIINALRNFREYSTNLKKVINEIIQEVENE